MRIYKCACAFINVFCAFINAGRREFAGILIMSQCDVDFDVAEQALESHDYDLFNTCLDLTSWQHSDSDYVSCGDSDGGVSDD